MSPTAYYTGEVWVRGGLAPRELRTPQGVALYAGLQPAMRLARLAGGPTLEDFLLARHRFVDHLLTEAIESGRVTHVVEVAAGLSPRGTRFAARYGDRITYVETDLPAMAARKRAHLSGLGTLSPHHRVEAADALAEGPGSLAAVLAALPPDAGVAVVTEGLLNYLPPDAVLRLWRIVADGLAGRQHGLYLSDLHVRADNRGPLVQAFLAGLGAFVRGRLHLHFADAREAESALLSAGFASARLHRPAERPDVVGRTGPGAALVRVVEARVGEGSGTLLPVEGF
ncbi:MAG TPA: class I SAM-dependent methyltransferase [Nocardioides sp.]|uniref:class I SAM-dependent methyltransferase n=1 Tax=Nocardioides sp. TaxID=35761 RepID=UPI002EDA0CCA